MKLIKTVMTVIGAIIGVMVVVVISAILLAFPSEMGLELRSSHNIWSACHKRVDGIVLFVLGRRVFQEHHDQEVT